jgi:hypothetical protein
MFRSALFLGLLTTLLAGSTAMSAGERTSTMPEFSRAERS